MAGLCKLDGQVELSCSADDLFEMLTTKQPNISDICSTKIPNIEAHQDSMATVDSTRRWDYVLDGKSEYLVDKIEAIDEEQRMIHRRLIEGDFMKDYKCMENKMQVIPIGDSSCIMNCSLEYEKNNEDAPEPQHMLDFTLGICKELASHLAKSN